MMWQHPSLGSLALVNSLLKLPFLMSRVRKFSTGWVCAAQCSPWLVDVLQFSVSFVLATFHIIAFASKFYHFQSVSLPVSLFASCGFCSVKLGMQRFDSDVVAFGQSVVGDVETGHGDVETGHAEILEDDSYVEPGLADETNESAFPLFGPPALSGDEFLLNFTWMKLAIRLGLQSAMQLPMSSVFCNSRIQAVQVLSNRLFPELFTKPHLPEICSAMLMSLASSCRGKSGSLVIFSVMNLFLPA